jgi:hypothetical protein
MPPAIGAGMNEQVHVMPRGDLLDHDESEDCVCMPSVEPVAQDDGSIDWVVVHHSLDGRELIER